MNNKLTNTLLTLLGVASFSFCGFQLIRLANFNNQKKEEEEKSDFSGSDKNLKTITFKLKNNTDSTQVEYLFDAIRGQDNPDVSVSGNLQFFNRELTNIPKKVKKIEFRGKSNFSGIDGEEAPEILPLEEPVVEAAPIEDAASPTVVGDSAVAPAVEIADETIPEPIEEPIEEPQYNQAEAPFKIVCRDASGSAKATPYFPLVSAMQAQGNITSVKFENLVLDGICLMKYTMYPKSSVNIIVYYEDMKKNK